MFDVLERWNLSQLDHGTVLLLGPRASGKTELWKKLVADQCAKGVVLQGSTTDADPHNPNLLVLPSSQVSTQNIDALCRFYLEPGSVVVFEDFGSQNKNAYFGTSDTTVKLIEVCQHPYDAATRVDVIIFTPCNWGLFQAAANKYNLPNAQAAFDRLQALDRYVFLVWNGRSQRYMVAW